MNENLSQLCKNIQKICNNKFVEKWYKYFLWILYLPLVKFVQSKKFQTKLITFDTLIDLNVHHLESK